MKHGEVAGYQAGCREECCGRAKSRDRKRRELAIHRGHSFTVPCERSRRKVQALAALGWPASAVAHHIGVTQQAMSRILARDTIRSTTAERIDRAYALLEMRIPEDTMWSRRTKNAAQRAGWLPPLAWEDIDAGVLADVAPAEGPRSYDRLDLEEVEYALQYHDFTRWLSPLEKTEIVRQWTATGRSERSLCALTGWRPGRYSPTRA